MAARTTHSGSPARRQASISPRQPILQESGPGPAAASGFRNPWLAPPFSPWSISKGFALKQPSFAHRPIFQRALTKRTGNRTAGLLPNNGQELRFYLVGVWHHFGQERTNAFPAIGIRTGLIRPWRHRIIFAFPVYNNKLVFANQIA